MKTANTMHQDLLTSNPPTIARNITSSSSLANSIACDDFHGTLLLPASDSYKCGTKTSNETLVRTCCNGAEVTVYLGCFMYCNIDDFSGSRMRDFVACLSSGDNDTEPANASAVDPNVFCQGELQAGVNATTSGSTRSTSSSSPLSLFVSVALMVLLLCPTVSAECRVEVYDSLGIRQAEAREFGPGLGCGNGPSPFCVVDQSGTAEIETFNRTLDGNDASNELYDEFFKALGEAVEPPRLFPATSLMLVRQWGVGLGEGNVVNYSLWAPFMVRSMTRSICAVPLLIKMSTSSIASEQERLLVLVATSTRVVTRLAGQCSKVEQVWTKIRSCKVSFLDR